jgi:hypothetical protein
MLLCSGKESSRPPVLDANGETLGKGVVANLGFVATHEWPSETKDFEVLYVAKSGGLCAPEITL